MLTQEYTLEELYLADNQLEGWCWTRFVTWFAWVSQFRSSGSFYADAYLPSPSNLSSKLAHHPKSHLPAHSFRRFSQQPKFPEVKPTITPKWPSSSPTTGPIFIECAAQPRSDDSPHQFSQRHAIFYGLKISLRASVFESVVQSAVYSV